MRGAEIDVVIAGNRPAVVDRGSDSLKDFVAGCDDRGAKGAIGITLEAIGILGAFRDVLADDVV